MSVKLLCILPTRLLCAGCKEPAMCDLIKYNDRGLRVEVSCDCGRWSAYDAGDYVRTEWGEWVEIAPSIH